MRPILHVVLHVAVPLAVAILWYRLRWQRAWVIMLLGIVIDVDHLWADPVYAPGRCSIGYHPLHTPPAILAYAVLAALPRTRVFGIGLLIHIALDALDCLWMRTEE